jgi:hypothetical protein
MEVPMKRGLFWILMVVLALAGAKWANAQVVAIRPVTPTVLTGGDFGFRVEADKGGTPVGELVVKVNGVWVPAELIAPVPKRISAK